MYLYPPGGTARGPYYARTAPSPLSVTPTLPPCVTARRRKNCKSPPRAPRPHVRHGPPAEKLPLTIPVRHNFMGVTLRRWKNCKPPGRCVTASRASRPAGGKTLWALNLNFKTLWLFNATEKPGPPAEKLFLTVLFGWVLVMMVVVKCEKQIPHFVR